MTGSSSNADADLALVVALTALQRAFVMEQESLDAHLDGMLKNHRNISPMAKAMVMGKMSVEARARWE